MGCPLCRLARGFDRVTKVYFEDEKVIVVDCKTCGVPMIVLKRHTVYPTQEEVEHLKSVALKLFPNRRFRAEPRSIKEHFHWHALK